MAKPQSDRREAEKQITERYSKSIEQLGNDKIEVRLGGIYALERIARDSPKDHWTIMEVLTSFVQEKSPLQENKNNQEEGPKTKAKKFQKITKDVQAALTVIGRRDFSKDPEHVRLDLSETNLNGADLSGANLRRINLNGADLNGAILWEANLTMASLHYTNLSGAVLWEANFSKAVFGRANLRRTDFSRAILSEAILDSADIIRANFSGVRKLTLEQAISADNWEQAIYDPDFHEKLGLPSKSTTEEEDN